MSDQAPDGRSERRARNRLAVVDAALSLVQEGSLGPPIEEVVKRSGLSQRSIFRYFEGLDDLRRAVIHRTLELAEPQLAFDASSEGPLEARVARLAAYRARLFETLDRPARLARSREVSNPITSAELTRFRVLMKAQVESLFAPELASLGEERSEELSILIATNLSFDAWDLMTRVFGRSPAQVAAAWGRMLLALFAAGSP